MADLNIKSDVVEADPHAEPIKVAQADLSALHEIQIRVDALAKYRQEMGRLAQLMRNMCDKANEVEVELAEKRRALADKYHLTEGQWALDFEAKEFVKTSNRMPAIP